MSPDFIEYGLFYQEKFWNWVSFALHFLPIGSQKGKDTEEGRNPQFLKPIMMLGLEGKLQLMQVCQVLWVCYYASLLFPRVT